MLGGGQDHFFSFEFCAIWITPFKNKLPNEMRYPETEKKNYWKTSEIRTKCSLLSTGPSFGKCSFFGGCFSWFFIHHTHSSPLLAFSPTVPCVWDVLHSLLLLGSCTHPSRPSSPVTCSEMLSLPSPPQCSKTWYPACDTWLLLFHTCYQLDSQEAAFKVKISTKVKFCRMQNCRYRGLEGRRYYAI